MRNGRGSDFNTIYSQLVGKGLFVCKTDFALESESIR